MADNVTRREFVKTATATAVGVGTALSASRVAGANERVRVAFIGVGNRGGQLIDRTPIGKRVDVAAVCDVYAPFREQWREKLGGQVDTYNDFRDVLDRKDIDAVFIATPDHWHAIQTIQACEAGKDVYIEKPLSITLVEGRKMVEVARRTKRVVQVGVHRRSSAMHAEIGRRVQNGDIGKVTVAQAFRLSNMYPSGIGRETDTTSPQGLDWELWLGPRPARDFRNNIAPYKFRWWQSYSSQLGNWGVHYFDTIRWLLGEKAPVSVSCHGGKFAVDDDRTIPDTLHATFEFASGRLLLFGQYEANQHPTFPHGELELRGTQGTLYAATNNYKIVPEVGGQFQPQEPRMEPETVKSTDGDLTAQHIENFLDCIKTRERPRADIEDGHLSTVFSHLGNIALATRSRVEWDADNERIVGNPKANELLHYEYRKPWTLG